MIVLIILGVLSILGIALGVWLVNLRVIVPTNVVHIVQRGKETTSYGVGKTSNVYYRFPEWMPGFGVKVRELPVSNFGVDLPKYSAYDKDRVPFEVDVKAFFHIADTNKAAEKVESFQDLLGQLNNVVQGSVRSILAKSKLEQIMEERSLFGQQFTDAVKEDLKSWGVEPIKSIELMDVRDTQGSDVIHQIMAKRMSAIEKESRIEVARNKQEAKQAELTADQEVQVRTAETQRIAGEAKALSAQAIGLANAEAQKITGIAQQNAVSAVAEREKETAEKQMEIIKVNQLKQAEIDKDKAIIAAEQQKRQIEISTDAHKYQTETAALAALEAKKREAEGISATGNAEAAIIEAKGKAAAEGKKADQLAGVIAQTTLAKEIGSNDGYQNYLIKVKEVEVSQVVGVAKAESMAKSLEKADLKILVNSGDVQSGIHGLMDIFSSKGASQINGLIEALEQTEEGKKVVETVKKVVPLIKKG